ncbi:MAG: A/G-specific adenine glycosylase [Planctomycetes bacterium]|nr:A/G-specific adenine glycosylase [Planctomycetota bacterium]MBI3846769.1 A/G-specific adenine glycosylase [Planctomycetota bacterium]
MRSTSTPELSPERVAEIRSRLLDWYRRSRRDLPWRRTTDPYFVWVSETMLQQTQVSTVVPYYQRFVERFPNVSALAEAPDDDLLAAWSGLGYYSRVRNLRAAAREVRDRFSGRVPDDYESFLALPGVGPYTAGAVMSIAFGKPHAVVDGNVARVLSRLFAVPGDPRRVPAKDRLWQIAQELVPEDAASDFNQGVMELGALVCTPRSPSCLVCPLALACEAHVRGVEEQFPEKMKRKASRTVTAAVAVVRDSKGRVLLVKRDGEKLLRGLWEFPGIAELVPAGDARRALAHVMVERFGVAFLISQERVQVRHSILERRITVHVFDAVAASPLPRQKGARFVDPATWESLPLAASARKIFRALSSRDGR